MPSPKVATYDLQPQMSAPELTDASVRRLKEGDDDFLLLNYANPDMVGHTGVMRAAIAGGARPPTPASGGCSRPCWPRAGRPSSSPTMAIAR